MSDTVLSTSTPSLGEAWRRIDLRVVAIALLVLVSGGAYLNAAFGWRQAALFAVGGALGLVLYHAAFGFTSAWRVFIADRKGAGLRAQMLMLALGCVLFFPALAAGSLFGQPVSGFVSPVGVSVVVGAFLFGIGMQLGGGCASGTLYTAGGGNTRMLVTLAGFIAGSVIATAHMHWWLSLPAFQPVSVVAAFGVVPALLGNLALFAGIAGLTWWLERRRHGQALPIASAAGQLPLGQRLLRGPWPLIWGAVALVLLNFATLALAGRPWGVTSAFALWGAKAASAMGVDVASWPYWSGKDALEASVWADVTTVMDVGIVLGALAAAGLAGKFAPVWRIPAKSLIAAVAGGLLLGYGARLAFGCNIGAYFSGIISGSLHGWVWLVAAFAGNVVGTRLRPLFGLAVERTARRTGC
ncbi:MAG TPA: YeeE/YedE family protein [Alphaproteobacteria bacterium]|nr:YeeE/YedE family protein [Alphaproteobacteria bacterium]